MVKFVEPQWLEDNVTDPKLVTIDTRPVVKYLAGHVPRAVNLPLTKLLDPKTLALIPIEQLATILSVTGIDRNSNVVLYDGYDGQSAALLAWTIEYLGHEDVSILSRRIEAWSEEGRELLYKPVVPQPRKFEHELNENVRAQRHELLRKGDVKILDLRSRDEFEGRMATEARTGHIPSARNIPWTDLIGDNHRFLRQRADLEEASKKIGLNRTDKVVTYCSYGPRAAVGYLAFQSLGYNVKVYDGSFHQWAQDSRLPVEGEGLQISL